jgi:hypothetical protein
MNLIKILFNIPENKIKVNLLFTASIRVVIGSLACVGGNFCKFRKSIKNLSNVVSDDGTIVSGSI